MLFPSAVRPVLVVGTRQHHLSTAFPAGDATSATAVVMGAAAATIVAPPPITPAPADWKNACNGPSVRRNERPQGCTLLRLLAVSQ